MFIVRLKLFLDNQKYDIFGCLPKQQNQHHIDTVFDNTMWYIVLYTIGYIICFNLRILNQYHYQL